MKRALILIILAGTIITISTVAFAEDSAPSISPLAPAAGITSDPTPIVAALISDMPLLINSGIDKDSATLTFDGDSVSGFKIETYLPGQHALFWQPPTPTNGGLHTITITIADNDGNVGTKTWTYTSLYPEIKSTSPVSEQAIEDTTPQIVASFMGGVAGYTLYTTASMKIDGVSVTPSYDKDNAVVSYQVPSGSPLSDGSHTVHVELIYHVQTGLEILDWLISSFESFFNMNSVLAQFDWTFSVDNSTPVASISSPASGATLNTKTFDITGSVKDVPFPGSGISQPIDLKVGTIAVVADYDEETGNFTGEATVPADGSYTITLNAKDMLGHQAAQVTRQIYVDTTPPMLVITSPVDGARVGAASVTLTGMTETGAIVKIAGTVATVQSDGSFSGTATLAKGENTITVESKDAAGNTATEQVGVYLDQEGPVITITAPGENETLITSNAFIYADLSDDGGVNRDSVTIILNGQTANDGCTITPVSVSCAKNLADGVYALKMTAADVFGNVSELIGNFKIDTKVPAITITEPVSGLKTKTAMVNVAGTTDGVSLKVNGIPVDITGGVFGSVVALQEGPNVITIEAVGSNGLTSVKVLTVTLDTIAPDIVITSPAEGYESPVSQVAFAVVLTDAGSGVNTSGIIVRLNDVNITQQCSMSQNAVTTSLALSNGNYKFKIEASDAVGNPSMREVNFTVNMIPQMPHLLQITSPENGSAVREDSIVVTGNTDAGATIKINDELATVQADGSFSKTIGLIEGVNAITVEASGIGGLTSVKAVSVRRDSIPPEIEIIAPAEGEELSLGQVVFNAELSDAGVGVAAEQTTVTVDGVDATGEAQRTASGVLLSVNLENGPHVIAITAKDVLGSEAQAQVSFAVNVAGPQMPPTLSLISPENGAQTKDAAVVVHGMTETGATVKINDVETAVSADGSFSLVVNLSEGRNVITAEATGADGLKTIRAVSVLRDSTPPSITIASPAEGEALDISQAIVTATIADTGVGTDVSKTTVMIDGIDKTAEAQKTAGSIVLGISLENGNHTITVFAQDTLGNSAQVQVSFSVNIDVTPTMPPSLTVAAPADGTQTKESTIAVAGSTNAGAAVKINGTSVTLGADGAFTGSAQLSEGTNIIVIEAAWGNGLKTIKTLAVTRDSTAPSITIASPVEGANLIVAQVVLSAVVTDAGTGPDVSKTTVVVDGIDRTADAAITESTVELTLTLSNGSHNIVVSSKDKLGNVSQARVNFSVSAATPAKTPNLTISYPASGLQTKTQSINVTGTTDAEASVSVNDAVATVASDGSFSVSVTLSEGANTIVVQASNAAGLKAVKSVAVTLDTVAPVITVQSPVDGEISVAGIAKFIASYTDEGVGVNASSVSITFDGTEKKTYASITANTILLTINSLSNSHHSFVLRVEDKVGNAAQASVGFSANIPPTQDVTPPELLSLVPSSGAFISPLIDSIEAVLRDPPGGTGINRNTLEVSLDGTALGFHFDESTGKLIANIGQTLDPGPHQIVIGCADLAGNVMPTFTAWFTVEIEVKGVKPDFIFTSNASGKYDLFGFYTIGGIAGGISAFVTGGPLAELASAVDSIGFPVRLTASHGYNGMASYSPNADMMAYSSSRDGNSEIYLMKGLLYRKVDIGFDGAFKFELQLGKEERLTESEFYDSQPAISRDGSKVVFVSNRNGYFDIYVMNTDGTGLQQLTDSPAFEDAPVFSPDGTRVAFVSNEVGRFAIYEISASGGAPAMLISGQYQNVSPQYNADGTKILFVANPDGWFDIYEYEFATGITKRLTNNKAREVEPVYSRNGDILFTMHGRGGYDIFAVKNDGTAPVIFSMGDDLTR